MKKLLLAAVAVAAVAPAHADNVWHTDDGRYGSTTELQRVFAGCHMLAMGSVPPPTAGGDWSNQVIANMNAGRAIDAIMGECMRSKGWLPGDIPAPVSTPAAPIPPAVISTKGLNANQIKAGCKKVDGALACGSPGTGMCWKKGHNPWYGQSPQAISVGNEDIDPHGPDEGHSERCG